jgi:hypothetical protein
LTLDGTFAAWGNATINGGVLEIGSTGSLFPVFGITATGLLMQPAYVLATYSPGGLTGTQFNSVTLPGGGWYLDYNYQGLNEIALVIPEPQTWMMLFGGVGMLTMFRRRRA